MVLRPVVFTLAAAACAPALAQDSTGIVAGGDALDAYRTAAPPNGQVADYAVDLTPITGSVCNMLEPPTGCKFHPRCQHAMDVCRREVPKFRELAPGHFAACHLHGRT